jgi:hypothetical protein
MRCWCVLGLVAGCGFSPTPLPSNGDGGGSGSNVTPGTSTLTVDLGNTHDLTGFPLAVVLNTARVDYSKVNDPQHGFTFADAGGNVLQYEVDHWNPSGVSILWVRLPSVPASTTPVLTMTYGSNQQAASSFQTWSGFDQALHFDALPMNDSAGGNFAPTASSITIAAGQLGNAGAFTSGAHVAFANGSTLFNHWPQFTMEFWLYADYDDGVFGAIPTVMNRGGGIDNIVVVETNPQHGFSIQFTFDGSPTPINPVIAVSLPLTYRQWNHFAYTFDGSTLAGFHNGQTMFSMGVPQKLLLDSSHSFSLGGTFQGSLDEFEVDQNPPQQDWVSAQYKAQTDMAITFSP